MPKPTEYRERASAAELNAAHAIDQKLSSEFLRLAAAWRGLATYSERSHARLETLVREVRRRRKDQAPR